MILFMRKNVKRFRRELLTLLFFILSITFFKLSNHFNRSAFFFIATIISFYLTLIFGNVIKEKVFLYSTVPTELAFIWFLTTNSSELFEKIFKDPTTIKPFKFGLTTLSLYTVIYVIMFLVLFFISIASIIRIIRIINSKKRKRPLNFIDKSFPLLSIILLQIIIVIFFAKTYEGYNIASFNLPIGLFSNKDKVTGALNFLYYSATTYYTVGFGDISALGQDLRALTILEMFISGTFSIILFPLLFAFYLKMFSLDDSNQNSNDRN